MQPRKEGPLRRPGFTDESDADEITELDDDGEDDEPPELDDVPADEPDDGEAVAPTPAERQTLPQRLLGRSALRKFMHNIGLPVDHELQTRAAPDRSENWWRWAEATGLDPSRLAAESLHYEDAAKQLPNDVARDFLNDGQRIFLAKIGTLPVSKRDEHIAAAIRGLSYRNATERLPAEHSSIISNYITEHTEYTETDS